MLFFCGDFLTSFSLERSHYVGLCVLSPQCGGERPAVVACLILACCLCCMGHSVMPDLALIMKVIGKMNKTKFTTVMPKTECFLQN